MPFWWRRRSIALQVIGYLQQALHHIRNLIFFVTGGFVLAAIALNSYPFQAPRTIASFMTIIFGLFAGGIVYVMVQADGNPTLSRTTNASPSALNREFFLRLVAYLGLPPGDSRELAGSFAGTIPFFVCGTCAASVEVTNEMLQPSRSMRSKNNNVSGHWSS